MCLCIGFHLTAVATVLSIICSCTMPQSALVSQLSKDRIDWKGDYRVVRKYRNPAYGHIPETLELCLMDREGGKIQATISNFLLDRFDPLIEEGELLSVTQFSVMDNVKVFPMADCPYKIMFQKQTVVRPIVRKTFPKTLFRFRSFSDIISGGHKEDNALFDIIGEIVDIKESKLKGEGAPNRSNFVELLLEDLDGNRLPCLLWHPYCEDFRGLSVFLRNGQRRQCVVVVQLCRTRMFKGGLGISNTYHATKVYFMVDLDEVLEYRSKLSCSDHSRSYDGTQFSYDQTLSAKDELENPCAVVMSIQQLKESDVAMRVWIVASVSEVIYDWDWCYTSCLQCRRKVIEKDSKVFCSNCKSYVVYNTRYKIHVRVCDGTGTATLLLWNDIAHQMIGELASVVAEKCVVEQYPDGDVEIITRDVRKMSRPEPVQDLVGRSFLFKVSLEQKHILGKDDVYHVEKVSEDDDLKKKYQKTDHVFCTITVPSRPSPVDGEKTPVCEPVPDDDILFSPNPVRRSRRFADNKGGENVSYKRRLVLSDEDEPFTGVSLENSDCPAPLNGVADCDNGVCVLQVDGNSD